jgi:hypothetical protein
MWVVDIKGNPNGKTWEIAIIDSENTHGFESYGWFGPDKFLISHNGGPCRDPLLPGLGPIMIEIADRLCDTMNKHNLTSADLINIG